MKFNIIKIILLVLFTAFQVKAHNKLDNGRVNTRVPSPAPYSLRLLNTSNSGALNSNTFTKTIPPLNTITLSSAVGTNSQSVCKATAITNITYTTTGATGATFSGLPIGVTGAWLSNVVTISGTPTASGTFSYIITLTGGFGTVTASGTIISKALPIAALSSSTSTICSGIPAKFNGSSLCGSNGAVSFSTTSTTAGRTLLTNVIDNITMETWVRWSGNATSAGIIFYNGHTGNGGYGSMINYAGNLQILIGGRAYLASTLYLTPGVWQHVAIVCNAGTWSIYLNGTQYSVSPNTIVPAYPNVTAGNRTTIGTDEGSNQVFIGDIDEAKFWTVARSTAEIQSDMKVCSNTTTAGLLAYWSLNDGSGTTATDGSGNNNSLTLTSPTWITTGAPTGGTYSMTFGDGNSSSLGADIHTYTTAGTYNFTINTTDLNGCSNSASNSITVNQSPTATISGTSVGCGIVSLNASGGTSYFWSGGNSIDTASNTFNFSNTYNVTATDAIGCWSKAYQDVTVNYLPVASFSGAVPTKETFAYISSAQSMVFDTTGNLYVASSSSSYGVNKITSDGTVSNIATGIRGYGITIDALGNLYVAERSYQKVTKITPEGITSTFATTDLSSPTAITIDASGNLYVIDGSTIKKITTDGTVSTFVSTGLSSPKAIIVDALGNLYVSNYSAGTISKITSDGTVSIFATGITSPQGLAFDSSGNLYVSTQTGTLQKVAANGTVSVLAFGMGSTSSIAFDSTGHLYTIASGTVSKLTFATANNTSVCNVGSVTLIATPDTGQTIDWYASATGGSPLLSDSNNYTTGTISSTTTYYAESRNTTTGCVAATRTPITATVTPGNTVTLSSAPGTNTQTICHNSAIADITYTTTGANGATFSGLPTGVNGTWLNNVITIAGTPTVPGNYTYTVIVTGGCSDTSTSGTITSNQLPTAIISGASVGCGTVSLTASGGISYVWSGGNSINTASDTFSSSNTYTVTATDANGCLATASQSVTVNSLPAIASNGGVPIKVTFATAANAQAIVFDTAGNLFVASSLNATAVRKITSDGTVSIFATGGSETGITIDGSGNLYVTERAGRRIRKITPAGVASIFVSTGLTGPSAITIDASGNLYVIDGSFIRMVDANGYVNTFTNSGLSQPKGLVCDASGNIYVSSAGTISKITPDGNVSTYSTAITSPLGLAFDSAGVLYVSTATGSIQKVTADGAATTLVSGIGTTPSLAFDSTGDLYTITGGVVYKLTFRATVCNGGSATLIATPASGETVDWYASATGGNPLLSDSNNYVTGALSSNTTFYVESRNTATGCVTATRKPITVTVNPLPTVETSVSPSATVCSETAVTLTGTGATSYTWSGGVTNGAAFTPASTETYTVTGTDANGCTNTATQTVTVTTNNTVTLISATGTNSQTICNNSAINTISYATTGATGATFSGLPTGVNGTWLNDVVTISGTPTVADNYTYTVTVTGGCGTITTSGTITVNSNPGLSNFNAVNKTFFDIAYTISPPTSTSLGAFTYTSSDTNVATINGSTVAIVGPGTASITATQEANGNYCTGSIVSTLTVNTVTVLTKHGEVSTSNLNYVNKNGAIGTDKSVTIHGEVISTK